MERHPNLLYTLLGAFIFKIMSINSGSKHYDAYYNHVSDKQKASGTIAKVYDLISDISDRRGLRQEWEQIDGDIQDEIIEKWSKIVEGS